MGGLKMAMEKFLGLKLTLSESNQLEKEAMALELTKTDYVKLLMKKGKEHLNDDVRNLQLKKMHGELDIMKRQIAGIVTAFNIFATDFNKREKVNREFTYETMKAVFEIRAITRKTGGKMKGVGEEEVKRSISVIDEHFKKNYHPKLLGGEK
jgi:hypothetical protein